MAQAQNYDPVAVGSNFAPLRWAPRDASGAFPAFTAVQVKIRNTELGTSTTITGASITIDAAAKEVRAKWTPAAPGIHLVEWQGTDAGGLIYATPHPWIEVRVRERLV